MKYLACFIPALATLVAASPLEARNGGPVQCQTCDPLPDNNLCDATTSCVVNWGHEGDGEWPSYCACRAGYKADPMEVGADPTAQWRLPWNTQEGRVFVRPGVKCDTLCEHWELGLNGCQEVPEYPQCM
ncbi:hypothetical protein BDY21DRAFT_359506 [Lineolata rhizophorae]|uniref:Uncharacterized protein n=1 Tax=Lineolata rhizophorae TaxID=578093 RepID=A0A6A6NLZ1_9PEZI|nr:hypothetical protein BDY21DRAFT_359506 [Lineolata rhizophorae]